MEHKTSVLGRIFMRFAIQCKKIVIVICLPTESHFTEFCAPCITDQVEFGSVGF